MHHRGSERAWVLAQGAQLIQCRLVSINRRDVTSQTGMLDSWLRLSQNCNKIIQNIFDQRKNLVYCFRLLKKNFCSSRHIDHRVQSPACHKSMLMLFLMAPKNVQHE